MRIESKTPVTIIGGYLGSGKTTLVNHLLRNANGKRLAILVNEFGELPIDADLIEAQDDDIISLSGGCVCCSFGNDLVSAMMDLSKLSTKPDHVVLEASGVALPGAIASSLSLLSDYSVDGIIVLADAETIQERLGDKYMGDTVSRQLEHADIVLLNKSDLVSEPELQATRQCLNALNPGQVIVDVVRSIVPPEVILQDFDNAVPQHVDHHHVNRFLTQKLIANEPVKPEAFAQNIIDTTPNLLRAKGFVQDTDGAQYTIQIVGQRFEISPASENVELGLVVITVAD